MGEYRKQNGFCQNILLNEKREHEVIPACVNEMSEKINRNSTNNNNEKNVAKLKRYA